MIHRISRLPYESVKWQVDIMEEVMASHAAWLASKIAFQSAHQLIDSSNQATFQEWYSSLAKLGFEHCEQYVQLGKLRMEMIQQIRLQLVKEADTVGTNLFVSAHEPFFKLFFSFYSDFHMAFNQYDYLTQMPNRQLFEMTLQKTPLKGVLVVADIDCFKNINDQFGHEMGDFVLKRVSRYFLTALHGDQLVARYGGEEFIFYLPNLSLSEAEQQIEIIRQGVEALNVRVGKQTCSFGMSLIDDQTLDYKRAFYYADQALYAAKKSGRNCIVLGKESSDQTFYVS